jgi:hypothetical protein
VISRVRGFRLAVGVLACVLLPAGSRLQGSGLLAWTMYSRTGEFRIDLVTLDSTGRAHTRNPTILASGADANTGALLAGSDHWREGASIYVIRAGLYDFAGYACRETGASSVVITLHERRGTDHETATRCERRCGQ